jgi:hypothetical protein
VATAVVGGGRVVKQSRSRSSAQPTAPAAAGAAGQHSGPLTADELQAYAAEFNMTPAQVDFFRGFRAAGKASIVAATTWSLLPSSAAIYARSPPGFVVYKVKCLSHFARLLRCVLAACLLCACAVCLYTAPLQTQCSKHSGEVLCVHVCVCCCRRPVCTRTPTV